MDGDDDICVLPDSSADELDAYPHPSQCVIPFSPLSPVPDFDRGSHHALQKAYADVKRRLNESNTKNQLLARRVRELETTKNSDNYTGVCVCTCVRVCMRACVQVYRHACVCVCVCVQHECTVCM